MIRHEQNQGVVVQPPALERFEDAPDLVVNEADRAVVTLPRMADLPLAEVTVPQAGLVAAARPVGIGSIADRRSGNIDVCEFAHVPRRRIIGAVRAGE